MAANLVAGWERVSLELPGSWREIVWVTPVDTPARRPLHDLTARDREEYVADLVKPRRVSARGVLGARRTILGDARDLMWDVFTRSRIVGARMTEVHELTASDLLETGRLYIHIGPTDVARTILAAVHARGEWWWWNGNLGALDSDGYVHLCVRRGSTGATHLILVGGSDYGTCFGVAAFLERRLQAAWVFPGEAGEVLPEVRGGVLFVPAPIDRIEEPVIRSRSFALTYANQTTPEEIDDVRTWQLRNGMRPVLDRATIFQLVHARGVEAECGQPIFPGFTEDESEAFTLAMLETEERIPSGHVMRSLVSPFQAPAVPESPTRGPERYLSTPEVFPDVRPRIERPTEENFDATARYMLHPALGTIPRLRLTYRDVPEMCGSTLKYEAFNRFSHTLDTLAVTATAVVEFSLFCGYVEQSADHGAFWRFLPLTWKRHRDGRELPVDGWHVCVFEYQPDLPFGRPLVVHERLARDLAFQLYISMEGRVRRYGDRAHSFSRDDGTIWCNCNACARGGPIASNGTGEHLFHRGYLICTQWPRLEAYTMLQGRAGASYLTDAPAIFTAAQWNRSLSANPFEGLNLDELAWCGVVYDVGHLARDSLRVNALVTAVCEQLQPLEPVANDFGTTVPQMVWRELPHLYVPVQQPDPVYDPVIAFAAYLTYVAPPIQSPDGLDRNERCHTFAMPYVTGLRDHHEYDRDPPYTDGPIGEAGALERLRTTPDQFNMERWVAAGARRLGLYEYIDSAWHVTPRMYTRRLRNALLRGQRFPIRGFVAEAIPNWGLDGPMFWELTRVLWNPAVDLVRLRREYCQHAFGAAATPMQNYLSICEQAWAATRDTWPRWSAADRPPEHVPDRCMTLSGAYFQGTGFAGRANHISQLDGWYPPPGESGPFRLLDAWHALNTALASFEPGPVRVGEDTNPARKRVRLVRQTFGLTLLIALWFKPLRDAFLQIRRINAGNEKFDSINNLFGRDAVGLRPMRTREGESDGAGLGYYVQTGSTADSLTRTDVERVTFTGGSAPRAFEINGDATLRDAVIACIGAPRTPGIGSLRTQVHLYLAASNLSATQLTLLGRRPDLGNLDDLGLGLCAGSMAETSPFPELDPSSPHRVIGMYLPEFLAYKGWWDGAPPPAMESGRSRYIRDRDAPGLGWVFNELRRMAAVVLLYSNELRDPRQPGDAVTQRPGLVAAILNG